MAQVPRTWGPGRLPINAVCDGRPQQRGGRDAILPTRTATAHGNGNPVYTQEIPFTDFPLDEVKLYFANNVIHLPSEY